VTNDQQNVGGGGGDRAGRCSRRGQLWDGRQQRDAVRTGRHGDGDRGDRCDHGADRGHRVRQHTGHHERGAVPAPPFRAEHIHRVAGRGRPDGGHRRAAAERGVQRDGRVAVWRRRVQAVADVRRAVLHRVNTEPVRDRAGQVPGHHAADSVRAEADRVAGHVDGGAGVDRQRGDQLAAADRLERLAGRVRREHAVHAHHAPRLRGVLVHGIVLHTAGGDEHHVLENIRGHQAAAEAPGQTGGRVPGQSAAAVRGGGRGAAGDGRFFVQEERCRRGRRRRRRPRQRQDDRGRGHRRLGQQQRRGGRGHQRYGRQRKAADGPGRVGGRPDGAVDGQARQSAVGAQTAHIAVQGTQSGQDVGRHHGRVCRQLAAVLRHLSVLPVLQILLSAVQGARQRGHVARLPELHRQPDHLHPVQHGLPAIV